jgi:hypothetical protein
MTAGGMVARLRNLPAAGDVPDGDVLLKAREVSEMLRVPLKRVYELGIPCVKYSARQYRWRLADVRSWIDAHMVGRVP